MLKGILEFFTGVGILVGGIWLIDKIGKYFWGEEQS
jgi:hypothetical protein